MNHGIKLSLREGKMWRLKARIASPSRLSVVDASLCARGVDKGRCLVGTLGHDPSHFSVTYPLVRSPLSFVDIRVRSRKCR